MADFSKPDSLSLYSAVWSLLGSVITSITTWFDGTTDTNVPNKAKRYNTSTNKFQIYDSSGGTWSNLGFHAAIDNHIADQTLHTGVPSGGIVAYGGTSAPTNFLLCQGQAVSRTTYSTLFGIIGTTYGAGDGSTTFNLPNLQGRFPLGKAAAGTGSTLGGTGGALDHTHSNPAHSHGISQHTHGMKNHVHGIGSHQHNTPAHEHWVAGHGHSVTHPWCNLQISGAGGSHSHNYGAKEGGSNGSAANRAQGAASTTGSNVTYTTSATGSTHTHGHGEFSGTIGAWDGGGTGTNGDNGFSTSGYGGGQTDFAGSGNTGAPNDNTTDTGGPTSTSTDGSTTSGGSNPAFQVVNFIIRI